MSGERTTTNPLLVVLATVVLTLVVLVVVLPNLPYPLHDSSSDITIYHFYADQIGQGLTPYLDFQIEYPPLAVPLFRFAGVQLPVETFATRFMLEMGLITLLTGVLVAVTAVFLWPTGRRAYLAGVLYALAVALTGAIIVNRYDVAVALVVAAFLLCLVRGWYVAAAVALGIGFALKITPAALLPLVLVVAGGPRRWIWPIAGFAGAGFAGFLPYLFVAPQGLGYVFQYHIERPLQIESVLGTPAFLGQVLGADWVEVGYSHGSWQLIAAGADLAADLSGVLTFGALVIVYVVLLAVLTLLLALMTFGKVLSPQYFIWILPVLALVAVREPLLGAIGALVLLMTQVVYPDLYGELLDLQRPVVALVAARNLLLLALFCVALWRLAARPRGAAASPLRAPH